LAFLRGWVAVATAPEHLARIGALLDGTGALEGLVVDADLRWSLLHRLVVMGARGPEDIDAEAERDRTATGQRQAAFARASLPTAEAKEVAWSAIMTPDALPNALLEATVGGFASPDQRDLLGAFTERYFDAVPGVWESRTNEIAQTIVMGLYPTLLVDPATVDRTERFLADNPDLPFGARRLVAEGADGVRRALRAREADRSKFSGRFACSVCGWRA
jgi:aminopeptidase N